MARILDARARLADAQIDRFLLDVGLGFNASLDRDRRRAEVVRLSAMSDRELARLDVTRSRIVAHVYRDLLAT